MYEQLVKGCVKAILEKYTDPIMDGITKKAKEEWEKFKVDFDIVFIEYLKNAYAKYSKIKTILYKTEPQFIYDFFEVPYLKKGSEEKIQADTVNSILSISNFIIIEGIGGIGKSTLMKHLFLDEVKKKERIPVFIELKDINDSESTYNIANLIFDKLSNLGSGLAEEYFDYALKSGCFLFLFDGYDEIQTDKRTSFFKDLDTFCDRYSKNYYVISSRPYSEFIELQRFTVLSTCSFSKEQAISLIDKINYDNDIKTRFIAALKQELYEKHESFASNPLLLSIMMLTFDNYAEIPSKLHLFYANAFETLFEKHDATKAGYRREIKSGLPYDSFRKVFSYFCFISYAQGKIEFSQDELIDIFRKIPTNGIEYEVEDYIYDLINSLCVLYKEGLNYKFTHRSFQEYFTAFFLKELPDEKMSEMGLGIIRKDPFKASQDGVFRMLSDMTEERFELNILLPIIIEVEEGIDEDRYDYYFKELVSEILFNERDDANGLGLVRIFRDSENHFVGFIFQFSRLRRNNDYSAVSVLERAEDELHKFMKERPDLNSGEGRYKLRCDTIMEDPRLYELVKRTWIGSAIADLLDLKERIENKKQNSLIDLTNLLQL